MAGVVCQLASACGQVLIDIKLAVAVLGVMRLELSASPVQCTHHLSADYDHRVAEYPLLPLVNDTKTADLFGRFIERIQGRWSKWLCIAQQLLISSL